MRAEEKAKILLREYKESASEIRACSIDWLNSPERQIYLRDGNPDLKYNYGQMTDHAIREIDKVLNSGKMSFHSREQHRSEINSQAGRLYGLACWLLSGKVVYDFAEDLALQLKEDARSLDMECDIPTDVFSQLPYPGMFVSTPSIKLSGEYYMDGFFVTKAPIFEFFDHPDDIKYHNSILFTAVMFENGKIRQCFNFACPILPGSLKDMLEAITQKTERVRGNKNEERTRRTRRIMKIFFEFFLYLCSENAKIRERIDKRREESTGLSGEPIIRRIGEEDSVKLRKIKDYVLVDHAKQTTGGGRTMPPHERRSHWHSYWVGKKGTQERKLILKWLLPITVHRELLEHASPTVVQKEN